MIYNIIYITKDYYFSDISSDQAFILKKNTREEIMVFFSKRIYVNVLYKYEHMSEH